MINNPIVYNISINQPIKLKLKSRASNNNTCKPKTTKARHKNKSLKNIKKKSP